MVKAIFFDFDGTLVDYYSVLDKACNRASIELQRILKEKGASVDVKELLNLVYNVEHRYSKTPLVNRDEWWKIILKELKINITLSREELRSITLTYWSEMMKAPPYPNVEFTLNYLKSKGYKLGIITNTDGLPSMKRRRIKESGLMEFFDLIIVAGEDTEKQKPDVEPFIKAAKDLNLRPQECVMVGDTLHSDIVGAKNAGYITVYLRGREAKVDESIPDYIINDIIELTRIF